MGLDEPVSMSRRIVKGLKKNNEVPQRVTARIDEFEGSERGPGCGFREFCKGGLLYYSGRGFW